MEAIEKLKMKIKENAKLLEKDPDNKIELNFNPGLDEEAINMYVNRIGYKLPDEFIHFYKKFDGLEIEKNNEKFQLWSLEDIYDKLKFNQKNDIYLHSVISGYHVQIAEHPEGALIMNVNGNKNYLYITHKNNKEWLLIDDLTTFFNNFTDCYFTAFWKDLKAYEYFNK